MADYRFREESYIDRAYRISQEERAELRRGDHRVDVDRDPAAIPKREPSKILRVTFEGGIRKEEIVTI